MEICFLSLRLPPRLVSSPASCVLRNILFTLPQRYFMTILASHSSLSLHSVPPDLSLSQVKSSDRKARGDSDAEVDEEAFNKQQPQQLEDERDSRRVSLSLSSASPAAIELTFANPLFREVEASAAAAASAATASAAASASASASASARSVDLRHIIFPSSTSASSASAGALAAAVATADSAESATRRRLSSSAYSSASRALSPAALSPAALSVSGSSSLSRQASSSASASPSAATPGGSSGSNGGSNGTVVDVGDGNETDRGNGNGGVCADCADPLACGVWGGPNGVLASLRKCGGCGDGGDEEKKTPADDLKRFLPMRVEPKTFFANERTLLKWINLVRPFI
jgi:hypothetical protein